MMGRSLLPGSWGISRVAKISARGAIEIKRYGNECYLIVLRKTEMKNGKVVFDVLRKTKPTGSYSVRKTLEDESVAIEWFDNYAEYLDELIETKIDRISPVKMTELVKK